MAKIVIERDWRGREVARIEDRGWADDGLREKRFLRDAGFYHDWINDEWRRRR